MTFNELNLSAPVLRAVAQAGYESPSPIQAAAIPPVLAGRDLMGCAQTGTGKTAAFALPMLDRLTASAPRKKGAIRALILTPTRELALQIGESFEAYGKYLTLRSTVIFGGVGQAPQVAALKKGVDILIACPGRLNDLVGQGLLDLSSIEIFVLDEADRMLDMGFVHDVKKVIAKLPRQRQNLMFSATMPKEIEQLAAGILHDPAFVKVDPVSSTVDRIQQSLYFVEKGNKKFLLPWLIKNLKPEVVNALVFSRTKHGADKIAKDLNKQGIPAAAIHGNKSQTARVTALEDFKAGKTRVLVATDIAARGIDISELSHVFNYDLPEVPETYVHRIGRTARAGADGTAVSFCAPEEKEYLAGIEKLNRRQIPVVSGHPWDGVPAPVKAAPPVRGKKPKAETEQPVKAEKPAKAEKAAKAEKPAAPKKEKAAAKQPSPKNTEPKEGTSMEENQKRTSGGRNENRRSNNSRPRREGNASQPTNRGSNAQPKFDPHFVSAPEATPLRPVKKAPAAQPAAKQTTPAQNGQRQRGSQPARAEQRIDRNDPRTEQRAERNSRNARPAQNGQSQQGSRNNRNAVQSSRPARPAKSEAPRSRSRNTAPARDEDPGLMLISRRPPQQKFTNFEEYMTAHGGATAPIEDHTDET
ncbi:DEAD/DEAH box helicase [Faecalibacterium prausnitzii]|uniref:DEAD/DEAH box helicase n=1 Tax=Faecalibacterium prausnitzii TaxID=853 RepID=UPI0012DD4A35|nr:DEAD/DEAH box helicase [Faecalibacterium prausnitzii]